MSVPNPTVANVVEPLGGADRRERAADRGLCAMTPIGDKDRRHQGRPDFIEWAPGRTACLVTLDVPVPPDVRGGGGVAFLSGSVEPSEDGPRLRVRLRLA